jgi:hypothetical protein
VSSIFEIVQNIFFAARRFYIMNKKISKILKKILFSDISCLAFTVAALLYNLWMTFILNPFEIALTHFIRDDNYSNLHILLIWAFLTGAAVFLNMKRTYKRGRLAKPFRYVSQFFMYAALIGLAVSVILIPQAYDDIHVIGSLVFAFSMVLSVATAFIGLSVKSIRYLIIFAVFGFVIYHCFLFLFVLRQMAAWEILPLLCSLFLMLIWNFAEIFVLKDKKAPKIKTRFSFRKIFSNGVVGMLLLASAVVIDFLYVEIGTTFFPSLVSLGRQGAYGIWDFEFVWRLITGVAVIAALYRFSYRSSPVSRGFLVEIFAVVDAVVLALACREAWLIWHGGAGVEATYALYSQAFTLLSFGMLAFNLLINSFKNIKYTAVTAAYFVTVALHVVNTVVIKDFPLGENLPILSSLLLLMLVNYTDAFNLIRRPVQTQQIAPDLPSV